MTLKGKRQFLLEGAKFRGVSDFYVRTTERERTIESAKSLMEGINISRMIDVVPNDPVLAASRC